MKTLRQFNNDCFPPVGSVWMLHDPRFHVATVVCVKVPSVYRADRFKFCPIDRNGIVREGLDWSSVDHNTVLGNWPNLRAYFAACDAGEVPEPPPRAPTKIVEDGVECRPGCAAHRTHPCERCGRVGALGRFVPGHLRRSLL